MLKSMFKLIHPVDHGIKLPNNRQLQIWKTVNSDFSFDLEELYTTLSAYEIKQEQAFKFTHLKESYIIRYGVLKLLLNHYL